MITLKRIHVRNGYFLLLDMAFLSLIPLVALALRVDAKALAEKYRLGLLLYTGLALLLKLPLFFTFGLYRRYWRYASVDELFAIALAVSLATAILAAIVLGVQRVWPFPGQSLPRSMPFVDGMLTLLAVGGTRFSLRALDSAERRMRSDEELKSAQGKRVLVVGAGDAGAMIVREIRRNAWINLEPVGFVDDDKHKQGMVIHGIPILGTRKQIPDLVATYDIREVVIAMPTAPGNVIREIVTLCEVAHVSSRTMPGIYEILSGQVKISHLRNVEIEDLLRREPVRMDLEEVVRMLAGKRVLITGAGGSIGSELCRQTMRCGPAQLTLLGHGENSLFSMETELRHRWPKACLHVMVADIRDTDRLRAVFERLRPQVVFHAAAHKHVPLMESNVEDAVTNNVGGTRTLVGLAERYDVEQFVLISSDKAVNPTNVMGATKRVAEMIVQAAARRTGRQYVTVRFGNVLGSRGSVVPLLREQIARGGPVTITHPDVRRYFMTIPEAVQLVLQAATLGIPEGRSGVFVLDMGEPIKIVDLARDLIELSGLEVGRDIEIMFTGLRPGEKLYEELFVAGETHHRTRHNKILVAYSPSDLAGPTGDGVVSLEVQVQHLMRVAEMGQVEEIRRQLQRIVPSYTPSKISPDNPTMQAPSSLNSPAATRCLPHTVGGNAEPQRSG